ncbi:hypothetical protein HZA73_03435 [candidate division TA06 bacterium]|nr:hypothetical protein [candidate division TA06 bacterium]
MKSKIFRKIAAIALFATISILMTGCSKDPSEVEKTPALTSVSLTDSIHAAFNSTYARECQIDIQLVYKIQDYSFIQSGSDSEDVLVYLHNGKTIIEPFNCFSLFSIEETSGLMTKTIGTGWISDTTAYLLRASDTLTTIDSAAVNIWWWYNGSRQTFHNKF